MPVQDFSLDYIILFNLLVYCLAFALSRKWAGSLFTACFSYASASRNKLKEKRQSQARALLSFCYMTLVAYALTGLTPRLWTFHARLPLYLVYLSHLGGLLVFFCLKRILVNLCGRIGACAPLLRQLGTQERNYRALASALLLPAACLLMFLPGGPAPWVYHLFFTLLTISKLLYTFYCGRIFLTVGFPLFLGFLYLCAFELMPTLALLRVLWDAVQL